MDMHIATLAEEPMRRIWGHQNRTDIERRIWLTVLRYHVSLGIAEQEALDAYTATAGVDTSARAVELEYTTRHDVKARIEAWNEVAGYEQIHLGMTSADIVDNAAQVQVRQAAGLLLLDRPDLYGQICPALGRQRLRGIVGAVGTGSDQLALTGRHEAPVELSDLVAAEFGFGRTMDAVGQQYPRSTDLDLASAVVSGISSAGRPASGLAAVAAGYYAMLAGISGDQWFEGDVSSSSVRRIALPGVYLAGSAACAL